MDLQAFSLGAEIDSYFLLGMMDCLGMLVDLEGPCDVNFNAALGRGRVAGAAELGRSQRAASLITADHRPCRKGELMRVLSFWLLVATPV